MPKIYVHYPAGAFAEGVLPVIAEDLTTAGLKCEHLPNTPFVRSTVWIYMSEYPKDRVFVGGKQSQMPVVSVEVNVLQGGLDDEAKGQVVQQFTAIIAEHLGLPVGQRCPTYVLIRESAPSDWGIFGDRITLDALRNPPVDAVPL